MAEAQHLAHPVAAAKPGGFATLLVSAAPELASSHIVEVATRLAHEMDAHLIGLGAMAPQYITDLSMYAGPLTADVLEIRNNELRQRVKAAEEAFRRDAAGRDVEWRCVEVAPTEALIQAARGADLIVAGAPHGGDPATTVDVAEVVMRSGKPVLIVPESARHLRAQSVVIGWNDSREVRRAVADALPLLRRAEEVIVHSVCAPDDADLAASQVKDVAAALRRQGVKAYGTIGKSGKDGATAELDRIADTHGADLVVAGAYGHSRLAEWIFGGVTNELLHRPSRFVLLSH
jgi:nucleotide-binding universal stress UspA family protein